MFVSKGFSIRIKLVLDIFHEVKIALRMVPRSKFGMVSSQICIFIFLHNIDLTYRARACLVGGRCKIFLYDFLNENVLAVVQLIK